MALLERNAPAEARSCSAATADPQSGDMAKAARRRPSSARYVTQKQFAAVLATLDERAELIATLQRTCTIQFERIAQMQVQLDHLERQVLRAKP